MTHDPFCPEPKCDYGSDNDDACYGYEDCWHRCQCALITKVREDERKQESVRRMAKFGYWHDYRPEMP